MKIRCERKEKKMPKLGHILAMQLTLQRSILHQHIHNNTSCLAITQNPNPEILFWCDTMLSPCTRKLQKHIQIWNYKPIYKVHLFPFQFLEGYCISLILSDTCLRFCFLSMTCNKETKSYNNEQTKKLARKKHRDWDA